MKTRKLILWSCVTGFLLGVAPVIQRVALLPLYLDGYGQQILSFVSRICAMLVLPGKVIMYRVWPPPGHYFLTTQLVAAAVFNALLYMLLVFLLLRFLAGVKLAAERALITRASDDDRRRQSEGPAASDGPASPARRTFLMRSAMGAAGGGAVFAGLAPVLLVPGWINVRRITFPIRGLSAGLEGLTIAHLTDFHHDEWISINHVRDTVQITNRLKPDIIALTGDYVTSRSRFIRPALREFARLTPRIGSVGVLGNHDWWAGAAETRRHFKESGIPMVDNNRMFVSADRRLVSEATDGICLAGVGDLWEDEIDVEKALHNVPEIMPRILLSHNPDVAEERSLAEKENRVDLMLSGHTHGGQVRLPFVGTPIVPSAYGSKYVHGLAQGPHCAVHTCAGIGMAMLPVRLGVPPEVVLITLVRAR